jgi:RNA polymerase sigma-70 factor (ECF subfamily)
MLGDSESAAEAVQETLLRIHRSLVDFRGDCALATWVYRIALNTVFSYRRRRRRDALPLISAEDAQLVVDEEADVEEAYNRKELSEVLARCIAKLAPQEAAAITLFYLDGCGYKEVASVMEISVGAVGLLLHRGRDRLHMLLTGKKEKR